MPSHTRTKRRLGNQRASSIYTRVTRGLSSPSDTEGPADFDPLSIGWTAAYWTDDPSWSRPADGAEAETWPDAIAAADLTGANGPTVRASVSVLGNKSALQFNGTSHALGNVAPAWSALSQPGEIVIVGALTSTAVAYGYFLDGNDGGAGARWAFGKSGAAADWHMYAGTIVDAGAPDLLGHFFDLRYLGDANSTAVIDGSAVITGDVGARQCNSLTVGASAGGSANFLPGYISFIGVHNGVLSAQQRTDLLAWSRAYYLTP